MSHPDSEQEVAATPPRGKHQIIGLGILLGLGAASFAIYWLWKMQGHVVSTQDAYVSGNIVQIAPQIRGTVVAIHADNTDYVEAGETLIKLDTTDAALSLQQAEVEFSQTRRETEQLFANTRQLEALAEVKQSELKQARGNLQRRVQLEKKGHISRETLVDTEIALSVANDRFLAATQQFMGQRALTKGLSPANHPAVKKAEIKIRNKFLSYARTNVISPVSGYVEKRTVQVGQRVEAGQKLMVVIPQDQLWVDANFKEVELRGIRIGQPATLTADLYGDKVQYTGQVAGIGGGTGSVFSLLPPQNATGNWIKIVQRVPVRIKLASKNRDQYPLRLGLSMDVSIDTRDQSGSMLAKHPRKEPAFQTAVYDRISQQLERYLIRLEEKNPCTGCRPSPKIASLHNEQKNLFQGK